MGNPVYPIEKKPCHMEVSDEEAAYATSTPVSSWRCPATRAASA